MLERTTQTCSPRRKHTRPWIADVEAYDNLPPLTRTVGWVILSEDPPLPLPRLPLVPAQYTAEPFVPDELIELECLDFFPCYFVEVRRKEPFAAMGSTVVVVIEVFG